jgi:uncharacterized protein involved in exopolysaccharide biosynthesis/Mrp family chromosome partitioning ATPase
MQQSYQPTSSLSIADIARGMLRRGLLILGCLFLGGLAGLGIIAVNAPQYASEAQLLVANLATPFDRPNITVQEVRSDQIDDRFVASQVSVLKSEDLAARVVKQLQLEGQGEFDPLRKGMGTVKKTMLAMGFGTDPRLMQKEQRAVEHLIKNASIYQVPLSNVIVVRYTALDGKTAAAVANALSETYVLSTRESQSGPNTRARDWLSGQIDVLRKKVSASEAAVEKFRAEAGLLKGQTNTLGTQEISELNSQITLAEAASSEARAKADEIVAMLESVGSVDASADVLNSAVVQRLREKQVTAMGKVSELSATYLPNHPKMVAANRELAGIEKQIRREALKVVDSLQGQAKVAEARADSLRRSLEELKSREGGALQSDVKLKELEREAAADRTLLETMLARYADANARQDLNLQPGYARVIQTASVAAAPFFPKKGPTLLLTMLAGLVFGLGLAFLFEVIRQSGRMSEMAVQRAMSEAPAQPERMAAHVAHGQSGVNVPELEIALNESDAALLRRAMTAAPAAAAVPDAVPQLLASLPAVPQLIKAFVQLDDVSAVPELAEPLARMAGAISENAGRSGIKSYVFTSIGGTYDAAFTCVALGRTLAARKIKTMVLDLSSTRPNVQDLMALADGPGLNELLAGQADVAKVIVRDHKSNVQVIRHGMGSGPATLVQLAAKMPAVLASLAQVYDVILVHAGEACPATPDATHGVGAVVFLASAQRQKDAVVAARTLATRGVRQSFFVKLDAREADSALRAAS